MILKREIVVPNRKGDRAIPQLAVVCSGFRVAPISSLVTCDVTDFQNCNRPICLRHT